jgi:DNA-binding NarL/FixJ family response regulator
MSSGVVALATRMPEMANWLSAACRERGFAVVWQRWPGVSHVAGAAAAIFDATDLNTGESDELRRFVAAVHPTPVTVLLDFPRIEDCERARSAGARTVVSKPMNVDDWAVTE